MFLLRNLTRGRGIGFFEAKEGESFFPDFILWVIEDGRQYIAFIDPHGLRNVRGINDPKIALHEQLHELAKDLSKAKPEVTVSLTSFIVATASYEDLAKTSWVREHTKQEFEDAHVLFQGDADYIQKLFDGLLAAGTAESSFPSQ